MWWCFLVQPFPLIEHMIGRAEFHLKEVFGSQNKTPGAIAPEVMKKLRVSFFRVRSTLLARIFELPQTSTWKWTEPTMKPVKRLDVHFMFSGAEGMQSALCGMYSLLGGRSAPHR